MVQRISQERSKVRFCRPVTIVLIVLVALVGSVGIVSSQQAEGKAKLQLPEGFPEDIPIYPKSEISDFYMGFSEDFEGGGLGTGFRAPAKYGEVLSWLKSQLKKKGWDIIQELNMAKLAQFVELTLEKDERMLQIRIVTKEEKDTVPWIIVGDLAYLLPQEELDKHKQPRKYLPEDIPLYPDSEMLGVALDTEHVSVQFKSKEEPVKMARHLIEEFEKVGWKIGDKMGGEELFASFGAEKGKRTGTVDIRVKENTSTDEKFSRITYTFKR